MESQDRRTHRHIRDSEISPMEDINPKRDMYRWTPIVHHRRSRPFSGWNWSDISDIFVLRETPREARE